MNSFWNRSLNLSTFILGLAGFLCITVGVGFLLFNNLKNQYEFHPEYLAIKRDQPVHRIINKKDVEYFNNLKEFIYIQNEELIQIGNFVEANQYGLIIHDKANQSYTFKPIKTSIAIIPNTQIQIINDYIEIKTPEIADRIDTDEELENLQNVSDSFYPSKDALLIGSYIIEGQEGNHLYSLIDQTQYSFEVLVENGKHPKPFYPETPPPQY